MSRYLIFAGVEHSTFGGMEDYEGQADNIPEARRMAREAIKKHDSRSRDALDGINLYKYTCEQLCQLISDNGGAVWFQIYSLEMNEYVYSYHSCIT